MHNIKTSYLIRESRAGEDEKMKSSTINLNFSSSLDSLQIGKNNKYKNILKKLLTKEAIFC